MVRVLLRLVVALLRLVRALLWSLCLVHAFFVLNDACLVEIDPCLVLASVCPYVVGPCLVLASVCADVIGPCLAVTGCCHVVIGLRIFMNDLCLHVYEYCWLVYALLLFIHAPLPLVPMATGGSAADIAKILRKLCPPTQELKFVEALLLSGCQGLLVEKLFPCATGTCRLSRWLGRRCCCPTATYLLQI